MCNVSQFKYLLVHMSTSVIARPTVGHDIELSFLVQFQAYKSLQVLGCVAKESRRVRLGAQQNSCHYTAGSISKCQLQHFFKVFDFQDYMGSTKGRMVALYPLKIEQSNSVSSSHHVHSYFNFTAMLALTVVEHISQYFGFAGVITAGMASDIFTSQNMV